MHGATGQQRLESMSYLGMMSVPIPRLKIESADAAEVGPASQLHAHVIHM